MKNKNISAFLLSSLMIFTSACGAVEESAESSPQEKHTTEYSEAAVQESSSAVTSEIKPPQEKTGDTMKMTVNGKAFDIVLEDNDTVSALKELLPLTLEMSELNGNEKYNYLETKLPSASEKAGSISEGDIMLYGDSCLVVFYDSFPTPYSYTRIGHISDTTMLAETLGKGEVTVFFGMDDVNYTEQDLHDLSDFLHGTASEDLSGKPYDLNGDNSWDVIDLCMMRKKLLK